MKPLTLYDFLRAGHVKRWHNVNTIHQQTLAEHQFMVMLIAMHLAHGLIGDEDFTHKVMHAAAFHDMPEVAMGDPPSPAKGMFREAIKSLYVSNRATSQLGDLFHHVEDELMPHLPYSGTLAPPPGTEIYQYVKMADKIADAHWIAENGVGAHAAIVQDTNWRALADLVLDYDTKDPNIGWHKAVNEVLMALGMKYVSLVTRTSPP